ncbi:MAG: ice-binding family protein, partial [Ignavibacteria bacterium]|nr:ice-binding family protein [Ignavibacteria bacterium]
MNINTNSLIKSFRRFTRFFSTALKSMMMIVVIVPVTVLSQSAPTVNSTSPINSAIAVALNQKIAATFNMPMDASTITVATFTLKIGIAAVSGFVSYSGTTAIFTPASNLAANAAYTAVITTGAKDMAGNALANNYVWSFTTGTAMIVTQIPVDLGTSGDFVILSKTGISTTGTTSITGDIGISPTAATYITGFGLIMDASGTFSTSSKVVGKVFASDYINPTPAKMTAAISDMETAYTNAAGRVTPDFSELYTGDLTGQTLTSGLYKWSTGVHVSA